jgi:hypothetical protein
MSEASSEKQTSKNHRTTRYEHNVLILKKIFHAFPNYTSSLSDEPALLPCLMTHPKITMML